MSENTFLIGNKNTKELHFKYCKYMPELDEEEREYFYSLESAIEQRDYSYCDHCFSGQGELLDYITSLESLIQGSKKLTHTIFFPIIGNLRTKETHVQSCIFAKKIKEKNLIDFKNFTDAKSNGFNNCGHCLPRPQDNLNEQSLFDYLIELESQVYVPYFLSKIENTDLEDKNKSTYTFLGVEQDFDRQSAINYAIQNKIKYICVVLAGQQGVFGSKGNVAVGAANNIDVSANEIYCGRLTGAERTGENGNWDGGYKIATSHTKPSVASRLYDKFHKQAIVLDIPNLKYNWGKLEKNRKKVEQYVLDLLTSTYDEIMTGITNEYGSNNELSFFICGFSRGGVMSVYLSRKLAEQGYPIAGVVSIDPVIKPLNEKDFIEKWAKKQNDDWVLCDKNPAKLSKNEFSILKSSGLNIHYNVFQRGAMINAIPIPGFFDKEAVPIGSAVDGAISPIEMQWVSDYSKIIPAKDISPFNQYDISVKQHTPEMLEKYWKWILSIAEKVLV